MKIAKSVSISPWLRLTYRFFKIKFVSILSEKFPLKKKKVSREETTVKNFIIKRTDA